MKDDCPKKLCSFPTGSRVRISEVCAGSCARCRVFSLGLTPGTAVEVVHSGSGPCRLKVRGSDLIIGQGLASKIMACAAEAADPEAERAETG
ncbi:MAG: ferrous iron transport protein A [Desulfovibrionaceae bacterium]|nr:ferrous iron transport protein A [Desulfovibrionaceae bacterium]